MTPALKVLVGADNSLVLKIGRLHKLSVPNLIEASREYCRLRDESGLGASEFPEGKVGEYRISYNGRVWRGKWFSGQKPVLEPKP